MRFFPPRWVQIFNCNILSDKIADHDVQIFRRVKFRNKWVINCPSLNQDKWVRMTWLGMHASLSVMEQVLHTAATAEAEYPWVSQRDRALRIEMFERAVNFDFGRILRKADSERTSQWAVNGMNGIPKQQKNGVIQAIIDAILGSMDDIKICDISKNNHISNKAAKNYL